MPTTSQKITPCLWFDSNCEDAITFYTSVFPNSKINHIQRYPDGVEEGPMAGMGGKVITAVFELDGYSFQALDGGPLFKLNPSISFMLNFDPSVDSNASENLETLWTQLSEGGKIMMPLGEYPFSRLYGWVED
ncbi:MAG: VOC family protein, partial [Candidatus Nanopelagicales bacterium]